MPLGEGWWIASDGKWYPANAHPDALARQPPPGDRNVPPAEGWWMASDGNWYAPELHPENLAAMSPPRPPARTAVTRASRTPAAAGGTAAGPGAPGASTGSSNRGARVTNGHGGTELINGHGGATNGHDLTAGSNRYGQSVDRPGEGREQQRGAGPDRGGGPEWRSGQDRRSGLTDRRSGLADRRNPTDRRDVKPERAGTGASRTMATRPGVGGPAPAAPGHAVSADTHGVPPPGDLDFDPLNDPATLFAEPQPGAVSPAVSRGGTPPTRAPRPGFGKTNEPPSGSTIRERLPSNQYRPRVAPGHVPRHDGFDEWLESFGSDPIPRTTKVTPPPQGLMSVADVLHGPRGSMGGPASATPRIPSREADFFVLKPSSRKPRPASAAPPETRARLSAAIFLSILFLVLVAVAVAFLYFHAHGIGPHIGSG